MVPLISRTPLKPAETPAYSSQTPNDAAIRRIIAEELKLKRNTILIQSSSETPVERPIRMRRVVPKSQGKTSSHLADPTLDDFYSVKF